MSVLPLVGRIYTLFDRDHGALYTLIEPGAHLSVKGDISATKRSVLYPLVRDIGISYARRGVETGEFNKLNARFDNDASWTFALMGRLH